MSPIPLRFVFCCLLLVSVASRAADPPAKALPLPGEVFAVEGRTAFVIPPAPGTERKPTPWVWYAPTLPNLPGGAERWMFERFTRAGIAIVGIDVGESYGSPEGRGLYTALYRELTEKRGFAPKAVMLGRSRGGLMTLAWAVENADKVAGFAGVYPVCNVASYPGVKRAAGAYGMTPEALEADLARHNPIDRLDALARVGVPLFAIHGDVDQVVPLELNSGEMKKRYQALGGPMELIIPAGQGHNMWEGFFQCQELVDFVIARATGTGEKPAAAIEAAGASDFDLAVAPVATVVEREGITGSGTPVAAGEGADRRFTVLYPNHPDDFGGSAGTGTSHSTDGGLTWTPGPDDWPLPKMVDLWQDRLGNGDVIAFGIRWLPDPKRRGEIAAAEVPPDAYRMALSRDHGRTWQEQNAVIDCPPEMGVIARPLFHVFEDGGGALHMPAYAWGRAGNHALLLRSEDGGRRWGVRSSITTAAAIAQSGSPVTTSWLETAVSPVADGSWLAVVRTGSNSLAGLVACRSTDQGLTWSAPEPLVGGAERRRIAGKLPTLQRLPNGLLALLTAHSKNHCRLYVSVDGSGREWSGGHIITSQSGGNAGMTVTGPDSLLIVTPANRRIDAWRVTLRPDGPETSPVAAPSMVTVSGAKVQVSWQAPADASQVARYRVTPVLIAPAAANVETEVYPYAPLETPDAATTSLELGRKLSFGGRYRFEVAAVDRAGRLSPVAASGEWAP
jgi:pimeloyl-ACP methyl ester carboxylesterase